MFTVEYKDVFSFCRECSKKMDAKKLFYSVIQEGVVAAFGKASKSGKQILAEVCFDKRNFSLDEAYDYWTKYMFFYIDKKGMDGKIPIAEKIISYGNGRYVAMCLKCNSGQKETIKKQIKNMDGKVENGESIPANTLFYEESLISKFDELCMGDDTPLTVVRAITILNAEALVVEPYDEDLLDFRDYFISRYAERQDVLGAIYETWGEIGPRIFNLADSVFTSQMCDSYLEKYNVLEPSRKQPIEKLSSYLYSIQGTVAMMFIYEDCCTEMHMDPSTETEEELKMAREETNAFLSKMLMENGCLVIFCPDKAPERCTVYGVRSLNGKFEAIPSKELENLLTTYMDGEQLPETSYRRIPVFF